jgi:glycyl-tRNA synthetase
LTVHANRTKQKLVVKETLAEPYVYEKLEPSFDAKPFGMKFKKDARNIQAAIVGFEAEEMAKFKDALDAQGQAPVTVDGTEYTVTSDLVKIEKKTVTEHGKSSHSYWFVNDNRN